MLSEDDPVSDRAGFPQLDGRDRVLRKKDAVAVGDGAGHLLQPGFQLHRQIHQRVVAMVLHEQHDVAFVVGAVLELVPAVVVHAVDDADLIAADGDDQVFRFKSGAVGRRTVDDPQNLHADVGVLGIDSQSPARRTLRLVADRGNLARRNEGGCGVRSISGVPGREKGRAVSRCSHGVARRRGLSRLRKRLRCTTCSRQHRGSEWVVCRGRRTGRPARINAVSRFGRQCECEHRQHRTVREYSLHDEDLPGSRRRTHCLQS